MFVISSFRALRVAVLPLILFLTIRPAAGRAADDKPSAADTAQDEADREALASDVLELAYSPSNLRDSFAGFLSPALDAMTKAGMPEAAHAEVRKAFTEWFNQEVKWSEIKPKLVQIYAHDFTQEELRALLAFLQKPLGQKVMTKLPLVMQDGALAGHDYFVSKKESLIAKIQPIFDKYSKAAGAKP